MRGFGCRRGIASLGKAFSSGVLRGPCHLMTIGKEIGLGLLFWGPDARHLSLGKSLQI
jgi:hypothetical protein